MKIDPTTGLPEAPENHYWRTVKEEAPYGEYWYRLLLVERAKPGATQRVPHRIDFLAAFGIKQTIPARDRSVANKRIQTVREASNSMEARVKAKQWGEGWYATQLYTTNDNWFVVNDDLSTINIYETAKRIIEQREAVALRKEREETLLGSYPPKSI